MTSKDRRILRKHQHTSELYFIYLYACLVCARLPTTALLRTYAVLVVSNACPEGATHIDNNLDVVSCFYGALTTRVSVDSHPSLGLSVFFLSFFLDSLSHCHIIFSHQRRCPQAKIKTRRKKRRHSLILSTEVSATRHWIALRRSAMRLIVPPPTRMPRGHVCR